MTLDSAFFIIIHSYHLAFLILISKINLSKINLSKIYLLKVFLIDGLNYTTGQAISSIARLEATCIAAHSEVVFSCMNNKGPAYDVVQVIRPQSYDTIEDFDMGEEIFILGFDVAEVAYVTVLILGLSMLKLQKNKIFSYVKIFLSYFSLAQVDVARLHSFGSASPSDILTISLLRFACSESLGYSTFIVHLVLHCLAKI